MQVKLVLRQIICMFTKKIKDKFVEKLISEVKKNYYENAEHYCPNH